MLLVIIASVLVNIGGNIPKYSFFCSKYIAHSCTLATFGSQSMPHLMYSNKNNIPSPPSVPHEIHGGSQAPNQTSPSRNLTMPIWTKKHVNVVTLVETLWTYTATMCKFCTILLIGDIYIYIVYCCFSRVLVVALSQKNTSISTWAHYRICHLFGTHRLPESIVTNQKSHVHRIHLRSYVRPPDPECTPKCGDSVSL